MKLCVIAPVNHLDLAQLGDMHFVLAQLVLKYPEYAEFYSKETKFKIMDNGAFELGKTLDTDALLEAAKQAQVNEIIAPDVPSMPTRSTKMTIEFFESLGKDEREAYDWMVVPHGSNLGQFAQNLDKLVTETEPDTVGYSILDLYKWNFRLRPIALFKTLLMLPPHVEVHLLGLDEPLELHAYRHLNVRSVDTSNILALRRFVHDL